MSIKESYNAWASQYDTNKNRTRDLDGVATKSVLSNYEFRRVLELGSGTGKNTSWLAQEAESIICVDFSKEMVQLAKQKITNSKVLFIQADITKEWSRVDNESIDLVTANLVLEHIENLNHVFQQTYAKLEATGLFFVSELHPFKQYAGTKARYETASGLEELEVYTHHISEFLEVAQQTNFQLVELKEWFDDTSNKDIPRLISFVFQK